MVKQWKKSLEQTDIVSDGTAFPGANIDAPISSAGATQTDIADGSDESDARWQTLFNGSLAGSQPDKLTVTQSGSVIDFSGGNGVALSSGTSQDNGAVFASRMDPAFNSHATGSILVKMSYVSGVDISTLADEHLLGFPVSLTTNSRNRDNTAAFYPAVGDSTAGNVRVDSGGNDTDAAVSFPDITETHTYTVLLDYAGNYLSSGHTGFYIDKDPRAGDIPDADVAATPNGAFTYMGFGYTSNGNGHELNSDYLEVGYRL